MLQSHLPERLSPAHKPGCSCSFTHSRWQMFSACGLQCICRAGISTMKLVEEGLHRHDAVKNARRRKDTQEAPHLEAKGASQNHGRELSRKSCPGHQEGKHGELRMLWALGRSSCFAASGRKWTAVCEEMAITDGE